MTYTAVSLRKRLKTRIDFDFWVRSMGEGKFWVGPNFGSDSRMAILVSALSSIGFRTECNGAEGTAGAHIIDAFAS